MIDFALEAEREQGMSPREAIHQACLLRFRPIMMTTMAALLGGLPLALGTRHRRRAAPAARHHDRRRPAGLAGADALHDAGHLPLHGAARRARSPARATAPRRPPRRRDGSRAVNISAPFIRRPIATVAARGGGAARRAGGVTAACRSRRCRASTSRPSSVSAALPGAQPRDDGVRGRDAARAPLRPDRRPHRDDVDELARLDDRSRCSSISTATSTAAARDVQAAINAAGGELPPNLPTRPELPQGQPGRLADPDPRR